MFSLFGTPRLLICDAKLTQELYSISNRFIDKTGIIAQAFESAVGGSFLFTKGDHKWQTKRKACAHAFYKDRMERMMEVLKEKLEDMTTKWMEDIEKS